MGPGLVVFQSICSKLKTLLIFIEIFLKVVFLSWGWWQSSPRSLYYPLSLWDSSWIFLFGRSHLAMIQLPSATVNGETLRNRLLLIQWLYGQLALINVTVPSLQAHQLLIHIHCPFLHFVPLDNCHMWQEHAKQRCLRGQAIEVWCVGGSEVIEGEKVVCWPMIKNYQL